MSLYEKFINRKTVIIAGLLAAVGLVADISGIIGTDYSFAVAKLDVAAIEAPTEQQVRAYTDTLKASLQPGSMTAPAARAFATEQMQIDAIPDRFKSYILLISNTSERDADDVTVHFALRDGDRVLYRDHFKGAHMLQARDSQIRGAVPKTDVAGTVSEIDVCLSFRGKFFVNRVEQRISISPAPFPAGTGLDMFGEPPTWSAIESRSVDRFVLGTPCAPVGGT
ncbi:hypothetical protein [Actibacterium ureilyticum]|uniref:hypothetical protein n=1 Tax=Actibacterium ureilyticum TaxID=1590614 RepID=UPI000BAAA101|nr:hypothetical protein [Actibacterium ureilyticum]